MLNWLKCKTPLIVLSFVFFLQLNSIADAGGSCFSGVSTVTETLEYDSSWDPPRIYTSGDTVEANDYVDIWIDNNDFSCPPFYWTLEGEGFHFGSLSGSKFAITTSLEETPQIWADSNACGSANIKVLDSCGQLMNSSVRTMSGHWVLIANCSPGAADGVWVTSAAEGRFKYVQDWCVPDCNINCVGGPCEIHTSPPTSPVCSVESIETYEWICE